MCSLLFLCWLLPRRGLVNKRCADVVAQRRFFSGFLILASFWQLLSDGSSSADCGACGGSAEL